MVGVGAAVSFGGVFAVAVVDGSAVGDALGVGPVGVVPGPLGDGSTDGEVDGDGLGEGGGVGAARQPVEPGRGAVPPVDGAVGDGAVIPVPVGVVPGAGKIEAASARIPATSGTWIEPRMSNPGLTSGYWITAR